VAAPADLRRHRSRDDLGGEFTHIGRVQRPGIAEIDAESGGGFRLPGGLKLRFLGLGAESVELGRAPGRSLSHFQPGNKLAPQYELRSS